MAIFLSKNSISTFSKSTPAYLANEHHSSALRSELLTRSILLCNFYVRANAYNISVTKDTPINDPGLAEAFSILKTAMLIVGFSEENEAVLLVLSDIISDQKKLDEFSSVHKFDQTFEDILLLYKDVYDLGEEPTIDASFLYHLDEQLVLMRMKGVYHAAKQPQKLVNGEFESTHFKFIGHESTILLKLNGVENDEGTYDYNLGLVYEDGTTTISFSESTIEFNQVITPFNEGMDQKTILLDSKTSVEISKNDSEIRYYSPAGLVAVEVSETVADDAPKGQSEDFVYYVIKPDDTFISIIEDQYYSDEDLVINDIEGNYIMTFPAQSMFSPLNRNQDVKLKFYLNYVYYYNVSKSADEFIENGIAANSTSHLTEEELDDFYNFSVAPDIGNPETLLTNYERFINYKTSINLDSKVTFDPLGAIEDEFYTLTPGSIIKLPNRKSADSLFNHINFRPEIMLEELVDKFAYVEIEFFEELMHDIDEAIDLLEELCDEAKEWLKQVYRDILQFFKDVYNYAIETLTRTWIRGLGGYLDAALGITWGIPIATDFAVAMRMYRKVTNIDELVLVLFKSGEFKGYLDAGVGVSYGYYSGNGSKRNKTGAQAIAGVQAGIKLYCAEEYEFPIRPEETALLAALGACLGPFGAIATGLASLLTGYNIDPTHYLVKSDYSFSFFFGAYAAGSLGGANTDSTINGGNNKLKHDKSKLNIERNNKSKGWMSSESIWDNVISGIGVLVDGELSLGYRYTYLAQYDNKPLLHKLDARVPSEVQTENNYFAKGDLSVGPMGSFLNRLLVNNTIGNFLKLLQFDKGVCFSVVNRVTRNTSVASFDLNDIKVNLPGVSGYEIESNNGNIKYTTKNVETELRFELTSGDYQGFLVSGSISHLTINTFTLSSTHFDDDFEFDDILFVVGLIKRIGFKHRMAISLETRGTSRKITDNILDIDMGEFYKKRELLKLNKGGSFGGEFGIALGGEIEFDLEEIFSTIEFYFKRAMLFIGKTKVFKDEFFKQFHDLHIRYAKDEFFYYDDDGEEITDPKAKNNKLFTKTLEWLEDEGRSFFGDITFDKIAEAFINMVGMVFHIDELLNPVKLEKGEAALMYDYDRYTGAPYILKICGEILSSIKSDLFLEASAGITKGFEVSAAEGAKVRVMFRIGAGVMFRFDILEDGALTIYYPDGVVPEGFEDFYLDTFNEIKAEIERLGTGIEEIFVSFVDRLE